MKNNGNNMIIIIMEGKIIDILQQLIQGNMVDLDIIDNIHHLKHNNYNNNNVDIMIMMEMMVIT